MQTSIDTPPSLSQPASFFQDEPREHVMLVSPPSGMASFSQQLSELLSMASFKCTVADSPEQALDSLQKHHQTALLILDDVPHPQAVRLLETLRHQDGYASLPVFVASSKPDVHEVIDLLRLQVVDYFQKPIYAERLVDAVGRFFPGVAPTR